MDHGSYTLPARLKIQKDPHILQPMSMTSPMTPSFKMLNLDVIKFDLCLNDEMIFKHANKNAIFFEILWILNTFNAIAS